MRKDILKLLPGLVTVASLMIACSVYSINQKVISTPKEKADFSLTAEEYDRIFTGPVATAKDLEKYAGKNIEVSGKVALLMTGKKEDPRVKFYAPSPDSVSFVFSTTKTLTS